MIIVHPNNNVFLLKILHYVHTMNQAKGHRIHAQLTQGALFK
jgi:hypothetical protein